MKLFLEIFIIARESDEKVRYLPMQLDITKRRTDPDAIVRELLSEFGIPDENGSCCSHSTSWRYEPGRTVLTYIVWVTREDLPPMESRILDIHRVSPPESSGPLSPRPREIRQEHVLLHGLRHLRFLMDDRRPASPMEAVYSGEAANLLQRLSPAVAGRIC